MIFRAMVSAFPRDQALFLTGWGGGKHIFVDGCGPSGYPMFFLGNELKRVMDAFMALPREAEPAAKGKA